MQSSIPPKNMDQDSAVDTDTLALADDTLMLGRHRLTIAADSLVLPDRGQKRGYCGLKISDSKSTTKSIPYYDILWAHITQDRRELVIKYAQTTSKNYRAVETKTFALPGSADDLDVDIDQWVESLLSKAYNKACRRKKRAFVLINPNAGPGGAEKIWEEQVKPIFDAAQMEVTAHRTERGGEAKDLAKDLDIDEFDVVIACSGDGMPHEIFNGLGQRPDACVALHRIAVCQIPCGSGNAMSCNLYGTHYASMAALGIVKGVPTPLDLMSITQGNERYLSFLSQAFGMMADLDIKSEHLRWMGHHRFTYWFLKLAMKKQTYPCDIVFPVHTEDKDRIKERYRREVQGTGSNSDDPATSSSSSAESLTNDYTKDMTAAKILDPLPRLKFGTVADAIPPGWQVVPHVNLGSFFCGNMPFMAPGLNFFSAATPNDGLMDVLTMNGDVSLAEHIGLQLSVESGKFFDSPLVKYRKVQAYRLIPREAKGVISIDGELVPFQPFQAEVHKGLGLTLSKSNKYEAPGPRNWEKAKNIA